MLSISPIMRLYRRNVLPLAVLASSTLLTLGAWRYTLHLDREQADHHLAAVAQSYQQRLSQRFETYQRALIDLRGLFAVNAHVSKSDFGTFIASIRLIPDFPGITRIGYTPRVIEQETKAFEARAQSVSPGFHIQAAHPHSAYYPVLFAYPMAPQVERKILGLDLSELPNRQAAMDRARDTDLPALTAKVSLPSDGQRNPAIGMFLPVFRNDMATATVADRRNALRGFVFEGFKVGDLLRGVFGRDFTNNFDLRIYDGATPHPDALLYDSDLGNHAAFPDASTTTHFGTVRIANRTWSLAFTPKPAFYSASRTRMPVTILISGLLASLLLTGITMLLNARRRLAWAQEEQHQRFRSLFAENPDAVFSLDMDGRFTSANEAAARLAGLNLDDLMQTSFWSLVPADLEKSSFSRYMQATQGIPQQGETVIVRPSGERMHLSVTSLPIIIKGRITGVFAIAKDVTERKQAEARNLHMQQLLDTIIDNIPVMLFVKEARDLRFVIWNKAGEDLTGFPRRELIDRTDFDLFDRADADYFRSVDRDVLARGELLDIAEEPIQTRTGVRLLHTRKVPFSMGDTQYLLGVSEDITERKRAEEALRESEARFRALFEQAPVGICQVNAAGEWLLVNQKLLDIVGYSFEELKTRHAIHDLTHPDDRAHNLALERAVLAGELDNYSIEKRYIRKDGKAVWVSATRTTIKAADGRTLFLIGIVEDITERKNAEERIRMQQQLLSGILDTLPLNVFIRDREERFVLVNKCAAATLGVSKEAAIGRRLAECFSVPMLADIRAHDERVWTCAAPGMVEERVYHPVAGRYLLAGKVLLDLGDDAPLLLGYSIDISELKRAEAALQRAHDDLEAKVRERTEELSLAYQSLKDLSAHLQMVREEERTRISREIHDEMGGVLTAMKIDLSMVKRRFESEHVEAPQELGRVLNLIDAAVQTLRRIITDLRPSILDTMGLWAALDWQLQEFQERTGVVCHFSTDGSEPVVDDDRATAIFRIVQETLTNVARHAQATQVDVFVAADENGIDITIEDNGIGFDPKVALNRRSFGILGMQERAKAFNGHVRIVGQPSNGTTVSIEFPLPTEAKPSATSEHSTLAGSSEPSGGPFA